jgi:hypothetical protein
MYAIPIIEQVPVAAEFDPHKVAVVNSVAVFGPRPDLEAVPFDMVLLSRIYSWAYAMAGRRSFMNKLRSHMYPPVIADFPWNEAIADRARRVGGHQDGAVEPVPGTLSECLTSGSRSKETRAGRARNAR